MSKQRHTEYIYRTREAQEIAQRAICLAALVARARIEAGLQMGLPPEVSVETAKDKASTILPWIQAEGLASCISPLELAIHETNIGELSMRSIVPATWRAEAIHALLSALNVAGLLNADESASPESVFDAIPFRKSTSEFIRNARAKEPERLYAFRQVQEQWHWRIRTRTLMEDNAGMTELKQIYEDVARAAYEAGEIPEIIQNDFVAFGIPVFQLSPEQLGTLSSTVYERHFAYNWICAPDVDWDDITTDT